MNGWEELHAFIKGIEGDYRVPSAMLENPAPLFAPGSARADETVECLSGCRESWWCAILHLRDSFSMGDGRSLKVAAAACSFLVLPVKLQVFKRPF